MFRSLLFLCVCLIGATSIFLSAQSDAISDKAKKLHFSSIVLDTHDDTTQRFLDPTSTSASHPDGHVDIPRMREGGMNAIFFSIWIDGRIMGPPAIQKALDQIDAVRENVPKIARLVLAPTADDMRRAHDTRQDRRADGRRGRPHDRQRYPYVRIFADLGVRYMTLTHFDNNEWADSSTDKPAHNGLTDFGKEVVREMNRLGMMVDISHVCDKTFYDALAVSKAPSDRLSLFLPRPLQRCPQYERRHDPRSRQKGGVIQINYHVGFLSQQFQDFEVAHPEVETQIRDEVKKRCGTDETCSDVAGDQVVREFMKQGKLPKVDWTLIIDHIDHAVKVGGIDHVGLGSDFDGAVMPIGMEDVTHLPQITDALLKKGYSDSDIRKILGENTLRVMTEVQRVSHDLNK